MKKTLLLAMAILYSIVNMAQCDPNYDFGGVAFGVSPDPTLGESFNEGTVGEDYEDVIHIIVPINAGDVSELFDGFIVDSLTLDSVTVTVVDTEMYLEDIGLNVHCNNNGDSEDPCTFFGGGQYCALIDGVPNTAGNLPLEIHVTGYLNVLGTPTPVAQTFDQYTLVINDGTISVEENMSDIEYVGQNVPNPFSGTTNIDYSMSSHGVAEFKVINLLGDVVYEEALDSKKGKNTVSYDGSELSSGIYLYSIETLGSKITKRMIVR